MKRGEMLDEKFFDSIRNFWEINEKIKVEEWGEYTDSSHKDYKEFLVFVQKFEE
jgi:hypothetical protein